MGRVEMLMEALPLLFSVPVPMVVVPDKKVTDPAVTGAPPLLTVAVMLTADPDVTLDGVAVRIVVVVALGAVRGYDQAVTRLTKFTEPRPEASSYPAPARKLLV
jgi:hypothetical protein